MGGFIDLTNPSSVISEHGLLMGAKYTIPNPPFHTVQPKIKDQQGVMLLHRNIDNNQCWI